MIYKVTFVLISLWVNILYYFNKSKMNFLTHSEIAALRSKLVYLNNLVSGYLAEDMSTSLSG